MLLKRTDTISNNPNNPYDCIIIGSGLAGMTAANTLAKSGHKVLLLEAHNKLGGFATWFFRDNKDFTFDISLHGFPYGMVKTCRKYWGKEIADLIIPLTNVHFDNPQFKIDTSFDRQDYTQILNETFNLEMNAIEQFFETVCNMDFYDPTYTKMTVQDLLSNFFPNRNDVWRFILEPMSYANGTDLTDPALAFGIVFSNFMNKGVYTFSVGTFELIQRLKNILLDNGVDIKMHSKVDRIIKDSDNKATAVLLDGFDQPIYARCILSNAHLHSTIKHLLRDFTFPDSFIESINNTRINTSSCQVYIGLKSGHSVPFIADLIFTSTSKEYNTDLLLDKNIQSRTFSMYPPTQTNQLKNYCIVSSTNARYEDWKNLSALEYKQEKDKMVEETIVALEKFYKGIRESIAFTDAATPLTIERYTHHPKGASFGTKYEGLAVSQVLNKHIPNVFHAGSVGIIMSGWLGAANYGVITANEIDKYLSQRIQLHYESNI